MTVDTRQQETGPQDVTDNSQVTFTRIACCAIGNNTSALMRQSLRAKLEREHEALKKRRQTSFCPTFRDLFG